MHFKYFVVSYSAMYHSLRPHELQHPRLPCPSLSPGVCSNSCLWSQWCHPKISSSVAHVFSCLQSFPAWRSFPMCWLFPSGDQSIWVCLQHQWIFRFLSPLGLTGLISLQSRGLSRVFPSTTIQKHQFFGSQPCLWSTSHIHTWQLENHSFFNIDLCWQSEALIFKTLSRFVITFLPRTPSS